MLFFISFRFISHSSRNALLHKLQPIWFLDTNGLIDFSFLFKYPRGKSLSIDGRRVSLLLAARTCVSCMRAAIRHPEGPMIVVCSCRGVVLVSSPRNRLSLQPRASINRRRHIFSEMPAFSLPLLLSRCKIPIRN